MNVKMELYLMIIIFILGALGAYVDAAFKMGYGLVTPVMLLLTFEPLMIIPLLLFAQMFAGFTRTIFYSIYTGVDYAEMRHDFKVTGLFLLYGMGASLLALLLIIYFPRPFMSIYIAIMAIFAGLVMITSIKFKYTSRKLYFLSFLSAFNQMITGEGYGPITTPKEVLENGDWARSRPVTSFSEALLSGFGFLFYYVFFNNYMWFEWQLILVLVISGIIATPLGAISSKYLNVKRDKKAIGLVSTFLGIILLLQIIYSLLT